ncbi:hypothetical protein, partial [Pseudoramibacter alactolyticus]|uniref:hypothetical protein n=1 Tax=Pseudoramibacter alactolyticus TaxID=113287 RepID=UPI00235497E3
MVITAIFIPLPSPLLIAQKPIIHQIENEHNKKLRSPKTPELIVENYSPICFATSSAKFSSFFSRPS